MNTHVHIKKGKKNAIVFLFFSLYVFLFLPLTSLFAQTAISTDQTPPTIQHSPLRITLSLEDPVILQANIRDNQTVTEVLLFYRSSGKKDYVSIKMERIGETQYLTIIPQRFVLRSRGIEYYIQASDRAGNLATQGTANTPHTISFKIPTTKAAQNRTPDTTILTRGKGNFRLSTASNTTNKIKSKKKPWYKKWWVWGIAIGVVAGAAAASGGGGGSSPGPASTGTGTVTAGIP